MRQTLATLVTITLGLFIFGLFVSFNQVFGQNIQIKKPEEIKFEGGGEFQGTPRSFCVTEDQLFLFPDYDDQAGTVKVFGKNGSSLKFIKAFGPNGFGVEKFGQPVYCFYSREEGMLGVIDNQYGSERRGVYIFDREGKIDFKRILYVPSVSGNYDIEFAGDGQQLVVSGYLTDKENQPYDLYSIIIGTGQLNYLLPSYEKYGLTSFDDYVQEYRKKQTLPAVGTRAYIDIQGDDVFFVWEGSLRIIKINLRSIENEVFDEPAIEKTPGYKKPNRAKLGESYVKGDFESTWKEQKNNAYIRNIFATARHVFLIYEIPKNEQSNSSASRFRLQTYTPEGAFLGDAPIPGNPGQQMWFSKDTYELYAFSESNNAGFSILKYTITNR
jgi:hypothetical protein